MHSSGNKHTTGGEARACSGKCRGQCSRVLPRVWVIAASSGLVSVLERQRDGLSPYGNSAYYSPDMFGQMVRELEEKDTPEQIILVGSDNDRAWLQATLPLEASRRIVAEIPQTLDKAWFTQDGLSELRLALSPLMP